MMRYFWAAATAVLVIFISANARAGFSTSVMRPTPVGADGVVSDAFPPGGGKASYYFSVNLQKGDLLTQISFDGRSGAGKQVELALLDENARVADSYWIHGEDATEEATRSFPIDSSGRRVLRLTVQGPETGGFRFELGGSAFVEPSAHSEPPQASSRSVSPAPAVRTQSVSTPLPRPQQANFSTTAQTPTPLNSTGAISATFPTGGKVNYYFVTDVQGGELLTQISYQGREGSDKELELALLGEDGRVADWYWIHGSEANLEATRRFAIDKKGKQVLRVAVNGPETGSFRVEVGGAALVGAAEKSPLLHNGFSRSIFAPTPVDESGVVSGQLPGNETRTYYYFAIDAQKGELLTQISYQSRAGAPKELELSVLGADARVAHWYWIHGSDAQEEATRGFPIDATGRTVLRVMVTGPETGEFRIELGGSALDSSAAAKRPPVTTRQANL